MLPEPNCVSTFMAHYLLLPYGSGGDVNPFIWLGKRLQARGHEVTLMTVPQFREFVEGAGLAFVGVGDEALFDEFLNHPHLWKPIRGTAAVFDIAGRSAEPIYRGIMEHLAKQTSILVAPFHNVAARMAREKSGARLITVHLQPAAMLSAHDFPILLNGTSWMKRLPLWMRKMLLAMPNPPERIMMRHLLPLMKREGIAPPLRFMSDWQHSPDGNLALFPDWFAARQPDWPENLVQAGFPLEDLRGHFTLPQELEDFLAAGEKPILFAPGTGNTQAKDFFKAGLAACEKLGCRALLGTRYAAQVPSPLPSWARHFAYLPFSQLLPRVSVLVHHGGIGTLSQALVAGVPQLVMPMAHDQPDNAHRLQQLGVGDWLSPRQFTGERVAEKLRVLMMSESTKTACLEVALLSAQGNAAELAIQAME